MKRNPHGWMDGWIEKQWNNECLVIKTFFKKGNRAKAAAVTVGATLYCC